MTADWRDLLKIELRKFFKSKFFIYTSILLLIYFVSSVIHYSSSYFAVRTKTTLHGLLFAYQTIFFCGLIWPVIITGIVLAVYNRETLARTWPEMLLLHGSNGKLHLVKIVSLIILSSIAGLLFSIIGTLTGLLVPLFNSRVDFEDSRVDVLAYSVLWPVLVVSSLPLISFLVFVYMRARNITVIVFLSFGWIAFSAITFFAEVLKANPFSAYFRAPLEFASLWQNLENKDSVGLTILLPISFLTFIGLSLLTIELENRRKIV